MPLPLAQSLSLLLLLCCLIGTPQAAELYVGERAVADEGGEARNQALSEILTEVLVRVSGNPRIATQPAAAEIVAAAPSLVEQYRYRSVDQDGALVRYLWARFDQGSVERMMRERNLSVWARRPRVLLWLALERKGRAEILNLDGQPALRNAVTGRAQQRGMPLQLPLLDLEDQGRLTAADLWSDYQEAIRQASARYPHDLILVGRLREQAKGACSASWSLIDRQGTQGFQTQAPSLAACLSTAVDQAQDLLAARFAPMQGVTAGPGTLVSFSGVGDLAAYGRLSALLGSLQDLAESALRYVDGDRLVFELRSGSGERELAQALEAGGQLAAEPAAPVDAMPLYAPTDTADGPTVSPAPEAALHYRVLP